MLKALIDFPHLTQFRRRLKLEIANISTCWCQFRSTLNPYWRYLSNRLSHEIGLSITNSNAIYYLRCTGEIEEGLIRRCSRALGETKLHCKQVNIIWQPVWTWKHRKFRPNPAACWFQPWFFLTNCHGVSDFPNSLQNN